MKVDNVSIEQCKDFIETNTQYLNEAIKNNDRDDIEICSEILNHWQRILKEKLANKKQ